jgi:light-regulated signal transduction histidine kinase (bacteriophytochrome)
MFEAFGRMMSSALEREGVFKTEFQMRRRDGRVFPTEHSVTEVTDDSGRRMSIVSVIRDISERKKAEDELKKYMGKLEQSNRDLEDFAYVASHDLQEPLRKIQAFGDRLKAKYGAFLGDEGINFIDRMQNASRRMQDLIKSILKYSRVATRGEPFIPVNLNEVVRDVVADLEARIEQTGGKVEVDTLPVIDADPSQMRQLFQNLIGNALKYIRAAEQPSIRIYAQKGDQECRVFVEDNGIGFDEKHLERIFRPFQRLHGRNEYEGTGMGLAIVKKIVSRHDGEVTARSAPGKGSTFIVTLPIHQSEGEMSMGRRKTGVETGRASPHRFNSSYSGLTTNSQHSRNVRSSVFPRSR